MIEKGESFMRDSEEEHLAGLQNFLKAYHAYLPKDNESSYCQNFAIDVLARNYFSQAEEAGTELDIKIGLPQKISIPDAQLCLIFGKIFQHAVEACKQQKTGRKFIRVRCVTEKNQLVLAVDHSSHSLSRDGPKNDFAEVRAVVENYYGNFEYQVCDGVAQISLMLFIP